MGTHKHSTTQTARETHNLTYKYTTPTQATPTQAMAMYVKNPKHHFGYHDISKSNDCNRFNSKYNQNLRFSKNLNSNKKPQNNPSTSRAINTKRKSGRIYT